MRKVITNMINNMNETPENRIKIHLYGAHETNIAGILVALNIWKRFIPEYGASIVFELHEKDSDYFVRVTCFFSIRIKLYNS